MKKENPQNSELNNSDKNSKTLNFWLFQNHTLAETKLENINRIEILQSIYNEFYSEEESWEIVRKAYE